MAVIRHADPGGRWYSSSSFGGGTSGLSPYSHWSGSGSATSESTGGRWGVGCLRIPNGTVTTQRYVARNWGITGLPLQHIVSGYVVASPNRASVGVGSALLASGNLLDGARCVLHALSDGSLHIVDAADSNAVLASSAAAVVDLSVGAYIEFACDFSIGSKTLTAWVNGTQVVTYTGSAAWSSSRGFAMWFNPRDDTGTPADWNDLTVVEGTTPLGPQRARYLLVSGNGSSTDGTANTGTAPDAVDEMPNDGDTTYVSIAGSGDHTFAVTDEAGGDPPSAVTAVVVAAILKRAEVNGGATVLVDGTTGTVYGNIFQYIWAERILDTDPDTAAAWSWANAQAIDIGFRVTSGTYRLTQILAFALTPLGGAPPAPVGLRARTPVFFGW